MNETFRRFLLCLLQAMLALSVGVLLCGAVALLLNDSPANDFGTGAWLDDPAWKHGVVLVIVAAAVGALCYLDRFALLGRRTWMALAAGVPGVLAAIWLVFAVAWMISPPSFMW